MCDKWLFWAIYWKDILDQGQRYSEAEGSILENKTSLVLNLNGGKQASALAIIAKRGSSFFGAK